MEGGLIMGEDTNIRLACEADYASILEIYAPFITDTIVSFECEAPTIEEFSKRIANIQRKYPWLVYEIKGKIVGYAYASPFNQRAAYDWSADFSIYIRPEYHGRNIGKALYSALYELLKLQGYCNVYAGIALPNVKSEGLHKAFGFEQVGIYKKAGFKFGAWHDVKWFQLKIQEYPEKPVNPKTIDEIVDTPEFKNIIQKAKDTIKHIKK